MITEKILQSLIDLQKSYAKVFRFSVTNERVDRAIKNGESVDLMSEKFREPLIEHVGHLPIIAAFLHSHLEHHNKVDLGRVLIMLAIHDIGETVLGDVLTFKKNEVQEQQESIVAQNLLSNDLDPYLIEFEKAETSDAKFATSIDKLAPLLRDLENPETINERHAVHAITPDLINDKKRHFFEWDKTMLDLFDLIIKKYRLARDVH